MLPKIVHHCLSYHGYDTHDGENNKIVRIVLPNSKLNNKKLK